MGFGKVIIMRQRRFKAASRRPEIVPDEMGPARRNPRTQMVAENFRTLVEAWRSSVKIALRKQAQSLAEPGAWCVGVFCKRSIEQVERRSGRIVLQADQTLRGQRIRSTVGAHRIMPRQFEIIGIHCHHRQCAEQMIVLGIDFRHSLTSRDRILNTPKMVERLHL